MDENLYRSEIHAAYVGEIVGAAAFGAMAQSQAFSDHQRAQLQTLARLEQVTRARLEPVMVRHGLAVQDVEAMEQGTRAAVGDAHDWAPLMESIRDGARPYIPRFEALLEAAPAEDAPVMRQLLEHERALVQFAIDELEGSGETSMLAVERALA